jgi:hypothetical protein
VTRDLQDLPTPEAGVPSAPAEPGQAITSPAHDQWLLDEALAETFPASDPISPSSGFDRLGRSAIRARVAYRTRR